MADEQPSPPPAKKRLLSKEVLLRKIYIKDLSFESPQAPAVFMTHAAPQTQLNIRSNAQDLGSNAHEVTLTLTVKATNTDTTVFLVELVQAGVFVIEGYSAEECAALTGSVCPGTLYPFAREAIANVIGKAGFPQVLLPPINFDTLYAEAERKRSQQTPQIQVAAAERS